jgi:non-canonical purine NTP pyrophosphatase (RdgB/HAM1 family)
MIRVNYVTSSNFKQQEIKEFVEHCSLSDGTSIKGNFEFILYPNPIHERLEVDIETMVKFEVKEAYSKIKIPCIVEHAGLIFDKYKAIGYPGGLTKPMWNTLKQDFLLETNSANKEVIARAVIGYCDGKNVKTFVGETKGVLSDKPRGNRDFYWDTIFIPDTSNQTYSEIVENSDLKEKLIKYSQSSKALISFLEYIRDNGVDEFWG